MFNVVKKTFAYGDHQVTIETGEVARQAGGAVMVSMEETVVLVTVVGAKSAKPGQDFFPLTVDYQEKVYAAGRIPGGFFKREGRPSEKETLTSRLIDRPIRPLFPEGFYNEVQVVATVMSLNPEIDADIPAMIGASAALSISGIPFNGPIGAARVGYINGQYVLCPTLSQLKETQLDLVVAGTESAVLMVESEAQELPEDVMLGAVVFGHTEMRKAINAINELVEEAGKPEWDWQPPAKDEALVARLKDLVGAKLEEAYSITSKQSRSQRVKEISAEAVAALCTGEDGAPDANTVGNLFFEMEAAIVRGRILSGQPRIDGRDTRTVRAITMRSGVLPRTHGSALFTRGETQAMAIATLGTNRDEQIIDALAGEYRDRFMLHYNMPPYATGECGRVGTPKRREIGHGRLAKRALLAVLPKPEDFSYSMRVVSEITESNGSSSMASVCGGCLALMDAGVPLKAHVAGIAMGLIKDGNRFAVLTDILGDEDHLGDMDFKVAGTKDFVTALQLDTKLDGIPSKVLAGALSQARDARLTILDVMAEAIDEPDEMSPYAPRITTIKIPMDKIGELIGPKGKTINGITEETGANISIEDDGTVFVGATDGPSAQAAIDKINAIANPQLPKVGERFLGTVVKTTAFGAFVSLLPGRDGLVHISKLGKGKRIDKVEDVVNVGAKLRVEIADIDERGKISLVPVADEAPADA